VMDERSKDVSRFFPAGWKEMNLRTAGCVGWKFRTKAAYL